MCPLQVQLHSVTVTYDSETAEIRLLIRLPPFDGHYIYVATRAVELCFKNLGF